MEISVFDQSLLFLFFYNRILVYLLGMHDLVFGDVEKPFYNDFFSFLRWVKSFQNGSSGAQCNLEALRG